MVFFSTFKKNSHKLDKKSIKNYNYMLVTFVLPDSDLGSCVVVPVLTVVLVVVQSNPPKYA